MSRRVQVLTAVLGAGLFGAVALGARAAVPAGPASLEAIVKDDKGKPVEEAGVYLVGGAPDKRGPSRLPGGAIMDQHDKEFIPHVLAVAVGTAVSFPNRDNIRHHVYSFSPAKKFELPLYMGTPTTPVVFDKAGAVTLGCNIHDWMVGYIFVVSSPLFGKSGPDGRVRIPDVPSGAWEVRVWHPRLRASTESTGQKIAVDGGGSAVAFTVSLRREWKPPRSRYDPGLQN